MPLQKTPLTVEHALLGEVRARSMHGIEFLAKLYSAQQQGQAAMDALIDRQLAAVTTWRQRLASRRAALPPTAAFDQLVLDYRIGQVQAATDWLATCRASLADPVSPPSFICTA